MRDNPDAIDDDPVREICIDDRNTERSPELPHHVVERNTLRNVARRQPGNRERRDRYEAEWQANAANDEWAEEGPPSGIETDSREQIGVKCRERESYKYHDLRRHSFLLQLTDPG